VTHIAKKISFGLVCPFSLILRGLQFFLGFLSFNNFKCNLGPFLFLINDNTIFI
jgi:hypothetical protein